MSAYDYVSISYGERPLAIVWAVEWKTIRTAFIRVRGGRTQEQIASEAGLKQGAISQLESNDELGPTVGTFVKAIGGLGLKPSEFFLQIETGAKPAIKPADVTPAVLEPNAQAPDPQTLRRFAGDFGFEGGEV